MGTGALARPAAQFYRAAIKSTGVLNAYSTRMPASVFITGGTGYIGNPLVRRLSERGHHVRALVRPGSERKLPTNCCEPVLGNALDPSSYATHIRPADTFVQLVGVSHPSPAKAAEFQTIDGVAGLGAIDAARQAGVQHFIYLSVAAGAADEELHRSAR